MEPVEDKLVTQQTRVAQQAKASKGKPILPTWRQMNWDTTPEAEAVLFKLWRETPAWRKLEVMEGLNRTARQLALAGLRQRFPKASPQELHRRLAAILLGEEVASRVYGPLPD
jgi:hypothetical protein